MKNHLYILLGVLVLFTACESYDGTCHKERDSKVGCALYRDVYDSNKEKFVKTAINEKLTISGVDNDSVLYDGKVLKSFSLPLHVLQDSTQFVIKRDSVGRDTLTIFHKNINTFISLECGCFVYYTIKNVVCTAHQIDSVVIDNSYVEGSSDNHLSIYYRVHP